MDATTTNTKTTPTIIFSEEARLYLRPRSVSDLESDGPTKKKRRAQTLAWMIDNGGFEAAIVSLAHAQAGDPRTAGDIHALLLEENEAVRRRCEEAAVKLWNDEVPVPSQDEDLRRRMFLLEVFPDRSDWAIELARLAIAAKKLPHARELLLSTLTDRDLLIDVVRAEGVTSAIVNIVPLLGEKAAPILGELIELAKYPNEEKSIARGLACIGTKEAAEIFVKHLRQKNIRPYAADLFARFPHLAADALTEVAKKKTQTGDIARTILTNIERAWDAPAPAAPAAPTGEAKKNAEQADLADLADQATNGTHDQNEDVATEEEIPLILREPPWSRAAVVRNATSEKRRSPRVLTTTPKLKVPRDPMHLHWSARARQRWVADRFEGLGILRSEEECQRLIADPSKNYLYSNYPKHIILPLLANPPATMHVWDATPMQVLALHGEEALESVVDRFADKVGDVRLFIESPKIAAALAFFELNQSRSRNEALRWLERYPTAGARGLVAVLFGGNERDGPQQSEQETKKWSWGRLPPPKEKNVPIDADRLGAELGLRHLARCGHAALIEEVTRSLLDGVVEGAREALEHVRAIIASAETSATASASTRDAPKKPPKMPSTYRPRELRAPRLKASGKVLPLAAVLVLDQLLCAYPSDRGFAGFAQIRAACESRSLAEHAWDLAKAWDINGSKSAQGWMLRAVANIGDDEVVRRLTPALKGEGIAAMLGEIATDAALMELITILVRVKRGVGKSPNPRGTPKKRPKYAWGTELAIERIAGYRGVELDTLVDHFVPTCDVDEAGGLALDLGARTFRITFNPQLKRILLDENGSPVAMLPRGGGGGGGGGGAADDPEKLKAAQTILTDLEEDVSAIAELRASSLESAMIRGRTWTLEDFEAVWAKHPLMRHMARGVVWWTAATTADENTIRRTFRIAEDGSFADAADVSVSVPTTPTTKGAVIGVAHPMRLDAEERERWRALFADYKLLQPFDQLDRQPARFSPAQLSETELVKETSASSLDDEADALAHHHLTRGGWHGWYGPQWRRGKLVCPFENNVYGVLQPTAKSTTLYVVRDGYRCRFGDVDDVVQCELYRAFEVC